MSIVRTNFTPSQIQGYNSATPWTTGSYSLPASSVVLVIVHGIAENDGTINASHFTLANSASLTVPSPLVTTTGNTQWGYGARAWLLTTTSAVSSTFTVSSVGGGSDIIQNWIVSVHTFTGVDGTTPTAGVITGQDPDGTGAFTLTLSATPTVNDVVIGFLSGAATSGALTATAGSGMTDLDNLSYTDWGYFDVQTRTASTSTSVPWASCGTGSGVPLEAVGAAFILKAAASGGSPAVLSSPTSSSIAHTTATVGCATDTTGGTLYAVAYTGTTPTATQIKAGQNSSGVTTPSGTTTPSTGAPTIALTGLTAGQAYNYALIQNTTNGDSNIVTGTFTTISATVPIVSSPTSASIGTNTATLGATSDVAGTMYIVATTANTQPTATQIKAGQNASGINTPHISGSVGTGASSLGITGLAATTAYFYWVLVAGSGGDSNIVTGTFTTLTPPPTLSALVTSNITGTGAKVGATSDQSGTLYAVLSTSNLVPTAAQIKAGQDGTGGTAAKSGNIACVAGTSVKVTFSALTAGTVYFYFLTANSTNGDSPVKGDVISTTGGPVLSSNSSSNVLANSATVGVTSTATGTLYAVAQTTKFNPTAAQIKAGQDYTGASVPAANGSAVVGANSLNLTGLAANTQYFYYFLEHGTGGDSNFINGTFTTDLPVANLSAFTATSISSSAATVGCSTDVVIGTLYVVVTTVNATPTAAQVKAGKDSTNTLGIYNSSMATTSSPNTFNATGLAASTTYYTYFLQHNSGGDSTVLAGNFTTAAPPPATISSPTQTGITQTTARVSCTTDTSGTLYTVACLANVQPTAAQIKTGKDSTGAAAAGANSFAIPGLAPQFTGLTPNTTYYVFMVENSTGGDSNILTESFTTLQTVATLSLPSSSAVAQTTASAGATSTVAGTMYVVASTTNATPTATQIKAGQDSTGAAAAAAANGAVTAGASTKNLTGLTAGTPYYFYVLVNNTGGDSNIVGDTFTTLQNSATISSPTQTSIAQTTATVGATTNVSGTLYAVASLVNTQPTATQIKTGKTAAGTTAPASGSVAITATATIGLTGLTTNTTYYIFLVENNTGGDSNIITENFTTLQNVATLTTPTSGSVTNASATAGATTDVAGNMYVVACTSNIQPSAAQIIAGQDSTGTTTPHASSSAGVGASSVGISGLAAATTYYYFVLVHTTGGDSNVVTGNFTTLVNPPVLSSPTATSVLSSSATIGANSDKVGTIYAVVTLSSSQPSISQIKAGQNAAGGTAAFSANSSAVVGANTFSATGLAYSTTYYTWWVASNGTGDSNVVGTSFTTPLPPAATLSAPASSNIASTSVKVGATSDTTGTMYVVVTTNNSTPTATQIKTSKDASGATVPAASGSAVVGANLLTITGLTPSTLYYYFVVETSTGGDSNIVANNFTTAAPPAAALTLPTSANVTSSTASAGATSDTTGTMYVVVTTTNTSPTATQIKAGQNASGATVPAASGACGVGATSLNLTGLSASTTYYYWVVENSAGGDSNIVTGNFTTLAPAPVQVGTATFTSTDSGTSLLVTRPSVQSGSFLSLVVWSSQPVVSVDTFAGPDVSLSTSAYMATQWHLDNCPGGDVTTTIHLGSTAGYILAVVTEWSNMGTATVDKTGSNAAYGTNQPTGTTGTLTAAVELAIAQYWAIGSTGDTITKPTGWTENYKGTGFYEIETASLATTAITALNPAITITGGNKQYNNTIVTYKPGAVPSPATLSAPTSSSVTNTTATVGMTTNTLGNWYAVASTVNTQPTNAQIKAGQNAAGVTTPHASGTCAVGTNSLNVTGLTPNTTYYYFLLESSAGGDSNVITGTFTTRPNPPTISSVSTLTPQAGAALVINGTNFNSPQSTGTAVLGGTNQAVTAWSNTQITATVSLGLNKYGVPLNVVVTNSAGDASTAYPLTAILPEAGWQAIDLTTPNTDPTKRITATSVDLAAGDQLAWGNIVGTGTVTVYSDGTFEADETVISFDVKIWTAGQGYGSVATQTITLPGAGGGGYSVSVSWF